jgi:hypothetical protein
VFFLVSAKLKLYSAACSPLVNFTPSIKKIKISWLVERKVLLLSALESSSCLRPVCRSNVTFGFGSIFIALCSAGIELGRYERQLLQWLLYALIE